MFHALRAVSEFQCFMRLCACFNFIFLIVQLLGVILGLFVLVG